MTTKEKWNTSPIFEEAQRRPRPKAIEVNLGDEVQWRVETEENLKKKNESAGLNQLKENILQQNNKATYHKSNHMFRIKFLLHSQAAGF